MSWLARSIANSLNFDDDDDEADATSSEQLEKSESDDDQVSSPTTPSHGVKEDLSELSKTLTRQFWGVASFLAPPPQPDSELADSEQDQMMGIRDDFAEIGDKFRSGISRLSNNINVSEITKLASNLLQLESDDETERHGGVASLADGAVGVTEEVVAFARDVAMHPQTWLNFPLPENDVEFKLSEAQQEHALEVERLSPELAALRIELSPGYMSECCFWKIYFVLVHPRLDKKDAEILSTPQILEAKALLAHQLKKQNTTDPENISGEKSLEADVNAVSRNEEPLLAHETGSGKASLQNIATSTAPSTTETIVPSADNNETQLDDNSFTEERHVSQIKEQHLGSGASNFCGEKDEDYTDDWLKEETSEIDYSIRKTIPIENEDDVSFSDLEDDDADVPTSYTQSNCSSDKDSRDWVQLGKSPGSSKENAFDHETKESNDWLRC